MLSEGNVSQHDSSGFAALSRRATGFSIFLAICLIVLGFLAVLLPVAMSFGVVIVVSWLLIIGAVLQVIDAFRGTGFWHTIWKFVLAAAYLVTGLFLRFNLGVGLAALTLVLIGFFLVQGVTDIFVYLRIRKTGAYGGLLLHGIVTLLLGIMIWRHWPSSALWVIGILVGINLIITGTTNLMISLAVRRAAKALPQGAA